MRKIITTTLLLLLTISTQAQSLTDMWKALTASTPAAEPSAPIPITPEAMMGRWNYSKLAVGLADNSPLKGAFGDAAISQIANLLNGVSASNGFSEGVFSLTIFSDKLLMIEFQNGAKADSPYILNIEDKSLSVNIDKINNIEIGILKATITLNKGNLTLLYDAKALMAIADKIPSIAENSQYQMVKGIVGGVEGVMLGFKLSRP